MMNITKKTWLEDSKNRNFLKKIKIDIKIIKVIR